MDKDWISYNCKSGQTLFVYNKETGEHKWPFGLPEAIKNRIVYCQQVKQVSTIATQTDDNGCNNRCTSMYVNTDPSHDFNTTGTLLSEQQPSVSDEENSLIGELNVTMKEEATDEHYEGQTSVIPMENCNNYSLIISSDTDNRNDHSMNTRINTHYYTDNQNAKSSFEVMARDYTDRECSTECDRTENSTVIGETNMDSTNCKDSVHNVIGCSGYHGDGGATRVDNEHYGDTVTSSYANDDINDNGSSGYHGDVDVDFGHRKDCSDGDDCLQSDKNNDGSDVDDDDDDDDIIGRNKNDEDTLGLKIVYKQDKDIEVIGMQEDKEFLPTMVHVYGQAANHQASLPGAKSKRAKTLQHECPVCKKKFTQKGYLKGHLRIHTGEKPHKCPYCEKCFAFKSTYNKHIVIHTNERSFGCCYCEKKFKRKDILKNHVKTHTGERTFECTYCNRKFVQRGSLQQHVRMHTGEKPFKCSICKKEFTRKATLESHHRVTHC